MSELDTKLRAPKNLAALETELELLKATSAAHEMRLCRSCVGAGWIEHSAGGSSVRRDLCYPCGGKGSVSKTGISKIS